MSIACVLVPAFALACVLAEEPALRERPVALSDEPGLRVTGRSPLAAARGVRPGMTVREAVGYCPLLTVLAPHPARFAQAAEALVTALAAMSPLVEAAAPGVVYADLRGLERIYPTPDALERALRATAPAALQPRLGVAGQKFTAFVAAWAAPPGGRHVVPDAEAAEFLAPQPVALLPLDEVALGRMERLGLATLGALAALPRHAVAAQFGPAGGWAWAAARGDDPTPLLPRSAEAPLCERLDAQPPLVSKDAILYGMKQLLGRALRRPEVRGRFVRAVLLRAVAESEQIWERRHVLKEPAGDRERLWAALRPGLEAARYPGAIVGLVLELQGLTAESGRQARLFPSRIRHQAYLEVMLRRLKTRYGEAPVKRLVEVEPWSRIPERRFALMDYDP